MGKIEILPTPSGNILKALVEKWNYSWCIFSWNGKFKTNG